jgi:hypothetical protein
MSNNLEALKESILDELKEREFVIFYGQGRAMEDFIMWDSDRYPDYRLFLQAAQMADVKLVVFHERELTEENLRELNDQLEEADLPIEEEQVLRRRVREIGRHKGMLTGVELSFDYHGRVYMFELNSEWYEEYLDLRDEIEGSAYFSDEDEDDESLGGGYFSRN